MTRLKKIILLIISIILFSVGLLAQGKLEDYQRAKGFLRENLEKKIFKVNITPHWIKGGSKFWYKVKSRRGKEFIFVDSIKKKKRPAFNHQKLAHGISQLMNTDYHPYALPFDEIEFIKKGDMINFYINNQYIQCNLKDYCCEFIEREKENQWISKSPDGKWMAVCKDFNVYIHSTQTNEEFQITTDGSEKLIYGFMHDWYQVTNETNPSETRNQGIVNIQWSPDSTKFVFPRKNFRDSKKLYLYQSMPNSGYRAQLYSYYRDLPGEKPGLVIDYFIFDVKKRELIPIQIKPLSTMENFDFPHWVKDSKSLHFFHFNRGYKRVYLYKIDAATGSSGLLIEESTKTYFDVFHINANLLRDSDEFIWESDRDGWFHLYLYDWKTGILKNQITKGEFMVRKVVHIDEKKRQVYFLACGRENGEDPYFYHLYRVNLDGSDITLLTPENAFHDIYLSWDKKFFVNQYSRVDLPPVTVLRQLSDGKIIMNIEQADIKELLATGWRFPEAFKVKARDGKTDLYGAIFKPSNFDPNKKYPIINYSYSGPMVINTPKTFLYGLLNLERIFAELGFIVIEVDGFGTGDRNREFQDFNYKNLGDIGAPDHIKAIKKLAQNYTYLDLSRIGILGHSAGGYDVVRALCLYPDFYKVGVAVSGNHDHRISKAWWSELIMGYPVGKNYKEQSNLTSAKNLKGKLLLMHGELDNNVNPTSTLRLAGELIKANKDFEMVIIPNQGHGILLHPYALKKAWDFFVRHLLGVTPPK